MQVKVKYKAIGLRGDKTSFTHVHECPDFQEEVRDCKLFIGQTLTTTVDEKVMDWLDEQDKMFLIHKHDVECIVDYAIVHPKEKKPRTPKKTEVQVMEEHVEDMELSDEMKINFFITYDRLKDSMGSLTKHEKVCLVFDALGLAMEARSAAFQHMIDRYDKKDDVSDVNILT